MVGDPGRLRSPPEVSEAGTGPRWPDVAFRAVSDDTARHQVNHAQVERGRPAREQPCGPAGG
ncbi:DUF6192 family protein [Streptomyces amakusaensis]|uniref:DUF6192 family protein n=1 Tax=Streptomyces amakusaensis TaxID=67271 RepID=A0ABW0ASP2_9ACTN